MVLRRVYVLMYRLLSIAVLAASTLAYTPLSDDSLHNLPSEESDFDVDEGLLLAPILIPRVPGTPGHQRVQEHFVNFFRKHLPDWAVEWHNSTSTTPATGSQEVPFTNLIFRRDPPWAAVGDVGRLTLVAHYDSLYQPEGFIGAVDSAAPCAILLHVARSIDQALTKRWDAMLASGEAGSGLEDEKGVQILFLDGEEAWVSWSNTDSLYGARALAEAWESTPHPAVSVYRTPLHSISIFVLLDLLGAANPRVPSWFQATHWAYKHLAAIEERMRKLELLETKPANPFLPESNKSPHQFSMGFVQDDHIPFMARGVDILHVIPYPFPPVWHTIDDDGAHLDIPTVRDWAKIITAFAAEWMDLEGSMPTFSPEEKKSRKYSDKSEL
ncbi:hypothetical protein VTK73DRAFT_6529 [Phialemonium thermophilum]|uniref:Peptide hydrolase n=1 Tax=Phialemonium thermophilum TaxID=223376 RepID=A0ABR3XWP0_9PEZI